MTEEKMEELRKQFESEVGLNLKTKKEGNRPTMREKEKQAIFEKAKETLGRIHRAGSHSKAIQITTFAAETIEEDNVSRNNK